MTPVSHPHNSQGVRSRATGLRLVIPAPCALALLLAATAVLDVWNLSASGSLLMWDGPPLLHGRAGTRYRRAGGYRCTVGLAAEVELGWPLRAGDDRRTGRSSVGGSTAPQRLSPAVAAVGDRR